ncbi:PREDICTED: VAN3-binding protein-like isoform X2 [Nelumbo nucifera]|uniref:VAN3-binding protein-like isoform X2 n=1 Tax=Nelumbo nucifera TaxID=4432 RepID=A0A1U8AYC3_NELNU|nr:PREDICTED: VAN3-binding protein-like isoform X2 [Nelumbo nucifera]
MDSSFILTSPQVPNESMDFLSRAWCNSALQVFQPEPVGQDQSIIHQDSLVRPCENETKPSSRNMDKSLKMDEGDLKSVPPWRSNDLKSWIWLQQAMHPELNYDRCFRKKWGSWKLMPFKNISVKKWLKDIRLKRKEEERLQRAEVHAAISVAGLAAALAAIAAENNKQNQPNSTKEAAVASAAALVAAQCAQVAETMGAKREQLSTVMGSAMTSTSPSDILTLTAAAATSLRGAATLRGRPGLRDRVNGRTPVLPIEENHDVDFDFDKCRSLLAKGSELTIETSDGKCLLRSVSIILNNEAKEEQCLGCVCKNKRKYCT